MATKQKNQEGFTIIELLISTTVFSLVLMVCLVGIMHITKLFYNGLNRARTQELSRLVSDDIGESLRYTANSYTAVAGNSVFCIGLKRYTFVLGKKMSSETSDNYSPHVLWQDRVSDPSKCSVGIPQLNQPNPGGVEGKDLLSDNLGLGKFEIREVSRDSLYQINIQIFAGDPDLMTNINGYNRCKPGAGAEYCAESQLNLTVEKRLGS